MAAVAYEAEHGATQLRTHAPSPVRRVHDYPPQLGEISALSEVDKGAGGPHELLSAGGEEDAGSRDGSVEQVAEQAGVRCLRASAHAASAARNAGWRAAQHPLVAFVDGQLGRVASGAAFPFLTDNERVIAANMSVHALV